MPSFSGFAPFRSQCGPEAVWSHVRVEQHYKHASDPSGGEETEAPLKAAPRLLRGLRGGGRHLRSLNSEQILRGGRNPSGQSGEGLPGTHGLQSL